MSLEKIFSGIKRGARTALAYILMSAFLSCPPVSNSPTKLDNLTSFYIASPLFHH